MGKWKPKVKQMAVNRAMTMNLFELAPKELTNSAIWAWILHGLTEADADDTRRQIASKMLTALDVPIPMPSEVHEVATEKALCEVNWPPYAVKAKTATDSETKGNSERKSGRIDVFLRTQGGDPYVFFIENKVVEQDRGGNGSTDCHVEVEENARSLRSLLKQIERYYRHFDAIAQRCPTYCRRVFPTYFGYEPDTEQTLIQLAIQQNSPVAGVLKCFPVQKMLLAFNGTSFERDPILLAFHDWLTSRAKLIGIVKALRAKNRPELADLVNAYESLGFGPLLRLFVQGLIECTFISLKGEIGLSGWINFKVKSRNSKKTGTQNKVPISVNWFGRGRSNGLFVGFHESFERYLSVEVPEGAFPAHFAHQCNGRWREGYFKSAEEIRHFWESIRPRRPLDPSLFSADE